MEVHSARFLRLFLFKSYNTNELGINKQNDALEILSGWLKRFALSHSQRCSVLNLLGCLSFQDFFKEHFTHSHFFSFGKSSRWYKTAYFLINFLPKIKQNVIAANFAYVFEWDLRKLTINYKHKFQAVISKVFSSPFSTSKWSLIYSGTEIFFVYTWRPFMWNVRQRKLLLNRKMCEARNSCCSCDIILSVLLMSFATAR